MIIGGLAAAVVVLTGGYDRLRDYVEQWTGDRFYRRQRTDRFSVAVLRPVQRIWNRDCRNWSGNGTAK